jgi:peptidoglycan/LPS O-acetylase OafA/YrhL
MAKLNKDYKKEQEIKWINYAKAFAISLIVYRHALTGMQDTGIEFSPILMIANDTFMSFSMQLFMMLSGIFFYKSFKKRTFNAFVKNKISTILWPYFVWVCIQLTVQIILSPYTNRQRTIEDYTLLFTHPRQLDQFWYLYALFFVTLTHALLNALKLPKWALVTIGIVLYFLAPLFIEIDVIYLTTYFYIFYALGDLLADLLLDYQLKKRYIYWALLASSILLLLSQWFYLNQSNILNIYLLIIGLIGSFFMITSAILLERKKHFPLLVKIGQKSMPIYLIHVLIVAATRIFLIKVLTFENEGIILLISVILGILIPVIFHDLTRKRFWWLYSLQR